MKSLYLLPILAIQFLSTAQAASPVFSKVLPRGGKPGTTVDVTFYGDRIKDIREILFYSQGLSVTEITPDEKNGNKVARGKLNIAPDAAVGEHKLRIITNSGISALRTFWVGPYETVMEVEPNSDFAEPQIVAMNQTIEGRTDSEDVDYYAVAAKKGQRLSVEVEAMRLGNILFDPYVAILNDKRFELAAVDDTALLLQDSFASIIVPEDGTYRIEVRDSSYGGSGNSHYRLHIGNFPRPKILYPAGAQANTEAEIKFIGDVGNLAPLKTRLPAETNPNFPVFAMNEGQISPSPNFLRVSSLPNVMEVEPNDSRTKLPVLEVAPPMAINGIIDKEGDSDWYSFKGKKGQRLTFTAHARSVRSPLDPVLSLYYMNGEKFTSLKSNDDVGRSKDSKIDQVLPQDTTYFLYIRDHLAKGGPDYVYRIEITDQQPEVVTSLPPFGNNDTQARQMIPIPRGNSYSTVVLTKRTGFKGDLKLIAENLPKGVTMHALDVPADLDRIPVVFEAAADAPLNSSLIDLKAKYTPGPEDKANPVEGNYAHEFILISGPGNSNMYGTTVDRLAAAVVEEAPFTVKIEKPVVPIIRRGSLNLKVSIKRKEDFKDKVTLRMLWNPPGIASRGTAVIPAEKDSVIFPLTANADAGLGKWNIAVIAEANLPTGQVLVGSKHTEITVEEPFLNMAIELAAIERGKEGQVFCTVEKLRDFQGDAEIRLLALPAHTTAEPQKINKDTTEVSFSVLTKQEAQPRTTKNLFISATIPYGEHTVVQTVATDGQIRIDNPPPAPKKPVAKNPEPAKSKPTVAAKPAETPKKPLSRLEKLRLLAQQEREGK